MTTRGGSMVAGSTIFDEKKRPRGRTPPARSRSSREAIAYETSKRSSLRASLLRNVLRNARFYIKYIFIYILTGAPGVAKLGT